MEWQFNSDGQQCNQYQQSEKPDPTGNHWTLKNRTYADINPVLGFGQTQACGGIEPVNGITGTFYNRISNTYRDINNQTTWPYSIPFKKTTHVKQWHYSIHIDIPRVMVMVFNATFNNISVISWRSVYWWRKPEYTEKNHRSAASHWQNLSHYVVSSIPRLSRVRTHNFSGDMHWLHR